MAAGSSQRPPVRPGPAARCVGACGASANDTAVVATSVPATALVPPELLALRRRLLEQKAELESELLAERELLASPPVLREASEARSVELAAREDAERRRTATTLAEEELNLIERVRAGHLFMDQADRIAAERQQHIRCLPALEEFCAARADARRDLDVAKAALVAARLRTSQEAEQLKEQVAAERVRQGTLEAQSVELRAEADDLQKRLELQMRSRQEAEQELAREAKAARAVREEVAEVVAQRGTERGDFSGKLRAALEAAHARGVAEAAAAATAIAPTTLSKNSGGTCSKREEMLVPSVCSISPANGRPHSAQESAVGGYGSESSPELKPAAAPAGPHVHQPAMPHKPPTAPPPTSSAESSTSRGAAQRTPAPQALSSGPSSNHGSSPRKPRVVVRVESDDDDEEAVAVCRSESMVGNFSYALAPWVGKTDNLCDSINLGSSVGVASFGVSSFALGSVDEDSSRAPSVSSPHQPAMIFINTATDEARSDLSMPMPSDVSDASLRSSMRQPSAAKSADARSVMATGSLGSNAGNSSGGGGGGGLTTKAWKLATSLKPARSSSKTSTGSAASNTGPTSPASNFSALGSTSKQVRQLASMSWLGRGVTGNRDKWTSGPDPSASDNVLGRADLLSPTGTDAGSAAGGPTTPKT